MTEDAASESPAGTALLVKVGRRCNLGLRRVSPHLMGLPETEAKRESAKRLVCFDWTFRGVMRRRWSEEDRKGRREGLIGVSRALVGGQ